MDSCTNAGHHRTFKEFRLLPDTTGTVEVDGDDYLCQFTYDEPGKTRHGFAWGDVKDRDAYGPTKVHARIVTSFGITDLGKLINGFNQRMAAGSKEDALLFANRELRTYTGSDLKQEFSPASPAECEAARMPEDGWQDRMIENEVARVHKAEEQELETQERARVQASAASQRRADPHAAGAERDPASGPATPPADLPTPPP
ncbi:MAG: hypothetical protein GY946_16520 [bacterium]|nr:hypothetical protein [bacterium]